MQGQTLDRVVLVLNNRNGQAGALPHGVNINSIYVGCSRVRQLSHLAVMPLTEADKTALIQKKHSLEYTLWSSGYDDEGVWLWRHELRDLALCVLSKFATFDPGNAIVEGPAVNQPIVFFKKELQLLCRALGLRRYSSANVDQLDQLLSTSHRNARNRPPESSDTLNWRQWFVELCRKARVSWMPRGRQP